MRKTVNVLAGILWLIAFLAACHTAKNSAAVDQDIAAAQERAAENTQKARQSADSKIAFARADLRSEEREVAHTSAAQTQKVADTEAEGALQVALAACEGSSGEKQKSCRDRAQADYEAAKARAARARAANDPKL
jgi:cytoskeletal protein RodZ